MREGHASRTAEHNALFRALESARPAQRRLLADDLACAFLSRPFALLVALSRLPGAGALLARFIDARWPGVRPSLVARTRWIDDAVLAALGEEPAQFVLLGAGFDTRPFRLAALHRLPVFEVDHPDTQAARRRALARARVALPANVRFVATDFRDGALATALAGAGYREPARTLFLWEGVTGYLPEAAVDATLRFCARAAPGSLLLFTYLHRDVLARPERFAGSERLFAALARAGESLRFAIEPAALPDFLAARGLALESDVGVAELRARAYGTAAQRMRGHEFYRVARARVSTPAAAARSDRAGS